MDIYVSNLDFKINKENLQSIFEAYGEVSEVRIIIDKFTGRSKGFGFVTMPNKEEGEKAIEALDGSKHNEREMHVSVAREMRKKASPCRF